MFSIRPRNRDVLSSAKVTVSGNCCWVIFNEDGDTEYFSPNDTNKTLIMSCDGNRTHRTIKRIIAENCNSGGTFSNPGPGGFSC